MACRLCLDVFEDHSNYIYLDHEETGLSNYYFLILKLIPQLNLELSSHPRICLECSFILQTLNDFKQIWTETENKISTYKTVFCTHDVDMSKLAAHRKKSGKIPKSQAEICRICLFYFRSNERSISIMDNPEFVANCEDCFAEMALDKIPNLKICETCIDTIEKTCHFHQKCLKIESVLNEYILEREPTDKLEENDLINISKRNEDLVKDKYESKEIETVFIKREISEISEIEQVPIKEEIPDEITDGAIKQERDLDFVCKDDDLPVKEEKLDTEFDVNVKKEFHNVCENPVGNVSEQEVNHSIADALDEICPVPVDEIKLEELTVLNTTEAKKGESESLEIEIPNNNIRVEIRKLEKSNKKFFCAVCDVGYKLKQNLLIHLKHLHDPKIEVRMYKCPQCDYQAVRKVSVDRHVERHHKEKTTLMKCHKCNYETYSELNLKRHIYRHTKRTNRKVHYCTYCSFHTVHKDSLNKHERIQHMKEDIQKCDICGFETFYKNHLRTHKENKHNSEILYKCEYCNYQSFSKVAHQSHVKFKHIKPETTLMKCTECSYETYSAKGFRDHVKRKHWKTQAKVYKCMKCDYETGHRGSLTEHVQRRHSEMCEVRHCELCDYKTFVPKDLRVHMRRMHKVKQEPVETTVTVKVEKEAT